MFYIDINVATFDITLTLGDEETLSPPPLALVFQRKGTNETVTQDVPLTFPGLTLGARYIEIAGILSSIFTGTGQYTYYVYDNTVPAAQVEIERGLCVVTDTPITKQTYGTDRERAEYKGHI